MKSGLCRRTKEFNRALQRDPDALNVARAVYFALPEINHRLAVAACGMFAGQDRRFPLARRWEENIDGALHGRISPQHLLASARITRLGTAQPQLPRGSDEPMGAILKKKTKEVPKCRLAFITSIIPFIHRVAKTIPLLPKKIDPLDISHLCLSYLLLKCSCSLRSLVLRGRSSCGFTASATIALFSFAAPVGRHFHVCRIVTLVESGADPKSRSPSD
jgi:hypothetical protein